MDLLLPSGVAPTNFVFRDSVRATHITSDMYNICDRLKELDPRLFVVQLEEAGKVVYTIMQHCDDGIERLALAQPVDTLDGRVIERLRYILAVPLHERLKALEEDERRSTADREAEEQEKLYETVGGPMRHELARCGFTGPLTTSAPLRNATARRHRNARV